MKLMWTFEMFVWQVLVYCCVLNKWSLHILIFVRVGDKSLEVTYRAGMFMENWNWQTEIVFSLSDWASSAKLWHLCSRFSWFLTVSRDWILDRILQAVQGLAYSYNLGLSNKFTSFLSMENAKLFSVSWTTASLNKDLSILFHIRKLILSPDYFISSRSQSQLL